MPPLRSADSRSLAIEAFTEDLFAGKTNRQLRQAVNNLDPERRFKPDATRAEMIKFILQATAVAPTGPLNPAIENGAKSIEVTPTPVEAPAVQAEDNGVAPKTPPLNGDRKVRTDKAKRNDTVRRVRGESEQSDPNSDYTYRTRPSSVSPIVPVQRRASTPKRALSRITSGKAPMKHVRTTAEMIAAIAKNNQNLQTRVDLMRQRVQILRAKVGGLQDTVQVQSAKRERIDGFLRHWQQIDPTTSYDEMWGSKKNGYLMFRDDVNGAFQVEITSSDDEYVQNVLGHNINLAESKRLHDVESGPVEDVNHPDHGSDDIEETKSEEEHGDIELTSAVGEHRSASVEGTGRSKAPSDDCSAASLSIGPSLEV